MVVPCKCDIFAFLRRTLPLLVLVGCSSLATRKGFYEPIMAELRTNGADSAVTLIEKARDDNKFGEKDRLLYFVDAGALNHYAGNYEISNTKLHVAEEAVDELFTKSVSRAAASVLLNDNVLESAGEDYENIYTNLFKALNYISLRDFDGAYVEIKKVNLKLEVLENKYADVAMKYKQAAKKDTAAMDIDYDVPKVRFYNDAFARYLSMHMYAADGRYDDARIDHDYLVDAFRSQPHIYGFPVPDVRYRAEEGRALISVVGLVGLAPVKEALSLRLRTDKDLNLVQILYDGPGKEDTEYSHLPIDVGEDFYFKFAIPQLVRRPSMVNSVRVVAGNQLLGELQLIEDVNQVAEETFSAKKTLIYLRTVARALAKGLAAHKLKQKADDGNIGGWLKKLAIDVGTDLSENADLRSTQFLPGRVFVGDFDIDPGTYDVAIEYYDPHGTLLGRTVHPERTITVGGLNLFEGFTLD